MQFPDWKEISRSDHWGIRYHAVSLAGQVIDIERKKGRSGISIQIQSQNHKYTTHTNSNGYFYFLDLPEGAYTLQANLQKPQPFRRTRIEAYTFKKVGNNIRPFKVGQNDIATLETEDHKTDENHPTIQLAI